MSHEQEIRALFLAEVPLLKAWGKYIVETVSRLLEDYLQQSRDLGDFLKIPPKYRVKDVESFIEKGIYRKHYQDPLRDTEDKVGARFVVLLTTEVEIVAEIIKGFDKWSVRVARDFEEERLKYPNKFDYQSQHLILRPKREHLDSIGISGLPEGLPREVQIRTLLQHAYSELSHDKIYKPQIAIEPLVFRKVARSMALIETADDIFANVSSDLNKGEARLFGKWSVAKSVWVDMVALPLPSNIKIDLMIIQEMMPQLDRLSVDALARFLAEKRFVIQKIKERAVGEDFYKHPVILIVYWMVGQGTPITDELKARWPLDASLLEMPFSDLGISSGH